MTPLQRLRGRLLGLLSAIRTDLSPNRSGRGGAKVIGAVIHTTESPPGSLEAVVAYLRNPSVQVSAHYVVGDEPGLDGWCEVRRLVPEEEKAWTAKSANPHFVQYELIGRASRSRSDWLGKHMPQLETVAALVAEDCLQYGFPAKRDVPGIVGHRDLSFYGFPNDHTDPGVDFPWDVFLKRVRSHIDWSSGPPPVIAHPVRGPNETCFQYAQRVAGVHLGMTKPPRWAWEWNAWLNSGRQGKRPERAPRMIPRWAWVWRECIHGINRHEGHV